MRIAPLLILTLVVLTACKAATTTDTTTSSSTDSTGTSTSTAEKTTAEKAFDAGQRARKKAEAIKAEEDRKAKETDDASNP